MEGYSSSFEQVAPIDFSLAGSTVAPGHKPPGPKALGLVVGLGSLAARAPFPVARGFQVLRLELVNLVAVVVEELHLDDARLLDHLEFSLRRF